jgi:cytochrome P450/NADPH-cytochrome P450 reductase
MASLEGAGVLSIAKIDARISKSALSTNVNPTAPVPSPLTILYGSNAGTCKSYAEDMETNAPRYGFRATVNTLDSAIENIPKNQPVIIIEPSYEGKPADNANKFTSWLESNANAKLMAGVKYAVFGVGNSDWTHTFHRIPKLTDDLMQKMGAERCASFGSVDVKEDIMGPWEEWQDMVWESLRKAYGQSGEVESSRLHAEITSPKFATTLGGPDITYGTVKANKELGGREVGLIKKHMEIELPIGSSYRSGDYMVILPLNNLRTVKRVIKRFELHPDDDIAISGTNKAFISSDTPLSVFDLLNTRVELGTPISQKQLKALAEFIPEDKRRKIIALAEEDVYKKEVIAKRFSVLDVLEDNPECRLPFESYLDMLKPLTVRQYSISSSPIANVQFVQTPQGSGQRLIASLTYDVHDEAAWSGADRKFQGVASTYLARQEPGDKLRCFTRATNVNFHLPLDHTVPIIMVCAGTGLAPMRGFIQERSTIKKARNATLGPAILYFGCRHHEKDFIYSEELKQWEAEGVVSVRPCFSKVGPNGAPKQYVPDRMWEDRKELADLFGKQNGKIFVCGSASKLAKSTAEVCKKIWLGHHDGSSEEDAQAWLDKVKEDRYVSDVFE